MRGHKHTFVTHVARFCDDALARFRAVPQVAARLVDAAQVRVVLAVAGPAVVGQGVVSAAISVRVHEDDLRGGWEAGCG